MMQKVKNITNKKLVARQKKLKKRGIYDTWQ